MASLLEQVIPVIESKRLYNERNWEELWRGRVPDRWVAEHGYLAIVEDVETARAKGEMMDESLVRALVTYPSCHVSCTVARMQPLNEIELAAVFLQGMHANYYEREIVPIQRKLGVNEEVINNARLKAVEISERVRRMTGV